MNSYNYVENAIRTESPITPEMITRISKPETIRLLHAGMGLATESGEFLDMLKKHIFYGKPLDLVNAREEIGDTLWYCSLAIDVLQTTLNEVMTVNINKLRVRYPEKFTEDLAENRNLLTERQILELEIECLKQDFIKTHKGETKMKLLVLSDGSQVIAREDEHDDDYYFDALRIICFQEGTNLNIGFRSFFFPFAGDYIGTSIDKKFVVMEMDCTDELLQIYYKGVVASPEPVEEVQPPKTRKGKK